MKTVRTLVATLAVAAATLLLTATPASAHAQLVSSDPKDGAILDEAPAEAVLEFSERVDAPSTQIALTDSTGAVVPTGEFGVDGVKVTVPLSLPAPGLYTIGYRIVSEDGHRVDGKIAFTSKTAGEGAEASDSPGASGNPPATSTSRATGAMPSDDGIPAIYWILGGIVLVAAVVVVIAVVTRRKATARPTAGEGRAERTPPSAPPSGSGRQSGVDS